MAENLRVTKYNDETGIVLAENNNAWVVASGNYCNYQNNTEYGETFGKLYNWFAVNDSQGLCMEGWHVPSDQEWMILEEYLGMCPGAEIGCTGATGDRGTNEGSQLAGGPIGGDPGWDINNLTNDPEFGTSGFTARPSGYRDPNGTFYQVGAYTAFWSSSSLFGTSAYSRGLGSGKSTISRPDDVVYHGFSVRCLADELTTGCTNPEACNYDEIANVDDGSCLANDCVGECGGEAYLDECGICNGDGTSCDGILLVPTEYSTIQSAIDAASDGDSVFVSAGTYLENINFNGKNIALIGEDRETTIIDGGQNGSVVSIIYSGENEPTLLSNFTLINGNSQHGGGISCIDSSPQLSNLIIKNNNAENDGGGISFISDFVITPVLSNTIIVNNTSSGVGFHQLGGGIACTWLSSPTIINCTVVNNSANGKGGGLAVLHNSAPTIINSIIYNNSSPHIYIGHQNGAPPPNLTFRYSDIYYDILNEIDGTIINWSNDSIDADPQFVDPENGDYTLQSTSPCIDAGDPNSPLDPDGTIADMGAFYFPQVGGCADSYATNYDDTANVDDGSCTYPDAGDYSLSFDGQNDYVKVESSNSIGSLFSGYNPFTIKFDINPDDLDGYQEIISKGSTNGEFIILKENNGGIISFVLYSSGGGMIRTICSNIITPHENASLVFSYDGGSNSQNLRVYKNGFLFDDCTFNPQESFTGINSSDYPLTFGARATNTTGTTLEHYYDGLLDNIAIWNYTLSDEEVLAIHNVDSQIDENGLIGYWSFNEGEFNVDGNAIAYDHSGNQNHGTINGATWYMEGCTDPLADNYNPDATVDDGSCMGNGYYALVFDESQDQVSIDHFDVTISPITFSFDVAFMSDQTIGAAYLFNQYTGGHMSLNYNYEYPTIGLQTYSSGWTFFGASEDQIEGGFDAEYHNITAVMHPGANSRIYYDYVLVAQGFLQNPSSLPGDTRFGGGTPGGLRMKSANIWYGSALSDDDITQHAENLVNIILPTNSWDFTNPNEATLFDLIGGNHGAISGAQWVQESISGCSTEPDACNYEEGVNFTNQICLYDDCEGICGGDSPVDNCGVCYGDNSTCDIQSTQIAVYYFLSISLNGTSLTPGDSILARNEESGMVVGSGIYGNAGGDITEVMIYGEMEEDYIINTDGLMAEGEIPQFYVDGHKANYMASDSTILQNIPPFYALELYNNLTLDLQTDCNNDMGGAASLDSCGVCSGGNSGHEADSDIDDCGVCFGGNEDKDCNGDCFGEALEDSCEVCSGGNSDHDADSDIDCNGDCFGEALEDSCEVCYGGNTGIEVDSELDCNGDCEGTSWVSDCGCVAYIDGETEGDWCDDCAGVPYGDSMEDECGVCDYNINNDSYSLEIILENHTNLISFPALPGDGDYTVENIFGQLCNNQIEVIGKSSACFCTEDGSFVGSLNEVIQNQGYWVILYTPPDTLFIECAVPVSYDGKDNFGDPCTNCNNGEVDYDIVEGLNLISYPFQSSQSLDDALSDDADNVFGLIAQGLAALNCTNYPCNDDSDGWMGALSAFEGGKGYWLIAIDDIDSMTFNNPDGNLTRIAHQPAIRSVPEMHRFMQSSSQAFYFIESATIYGKALDSEDIIIAYNGDVVVGARYWNGEYTDVPAMGMDDYSNSEGYCKSGDQISFKVWDASVNELVDMETDIKTPWNDLSLSVINITEILPDDFSLERAYPNPFNPTTTLNFTLPIEVELSITIYNLQGREVISLVDSNMPAGYHSVVWNADVHASGVYFVKMVAGEYVKTQKLMLVK